ncbi:hypothetical protein QFC22_005674 [Naganishia vaughanmartiniae]|uniref:Uncharacterized protein n=1 Tax=Naganishia vaughanmartiniae TaxID=1424756 RepID=A0ACC2WT59_9TREE|nr:hypothetical protein QFC22_005674 [Naganishia vaughanmartiniae]
MLLSLTTTLLLVTASVNASPLFPRQQANTTTSSVGNTTTTIPAASKANITAATVYFPLSTNGTTVPNGSVPVYGYTNTQYNVSSFLGIPFATSERFRAPVLSTYNATGLNASAHGVACMQSPGVGKSLLNGSYTSRGVGEDCLTVDVYTPAGAGNGTKLPVMVWFFGGGFINGANSVYDGTAIIAQSVLMRSPVILVVPNYRLNIYGWLNGAEALANNATNLGMRDQLASLEWVQKYAQAFGGDKNKVTVFGESAGAISIALHYLNPALVGNSTTVNGTRQAMNSTVQAGNTTVTTINSTAPLSLFRGAIMQSGAMSTFPIGPANETRQPIFDRISLLTGCSRNASTAYPGGNLTSAFNQTEFECLRTLPNDLLFNATRTVLDDPANAYGNFPFGPTIDYSLIPASPAALLAKGSFAQNIPFISGNMLDEGTLFTPPTLNTTAQVTSYVNEVLPRDPNTTVVNTLYAYYNDPSKGSPYGSGNESFGLNPLYVILLFPPRSHTNPRFGRFKTTAALFGDTTFQSSRRNFLQKANQFNVTKTWSYLFSQKKNGTSTYLGAPHGSDVLYTFGQPGGNAADLTVSRQFLGYFINFANNLDPNGNTTNPITALVSSTLNLTSWPAYSTRTTGGTTNMLQILANNLTVIQDTYRSEAIAYINSVPEALDH